MRKYREGPLLSTLLRLPYQGHGPRAEQTKPINISDFHYPTHSYCETIHALGHEWSRV